ncbi:helix-turn-helix domain-containing protein [Flavobacterium sp. MC2016-06]|uniref:helix-turn-helix domain-containing protein n=1 Tax=Flavobacterium sp. MC2016-06 TaxID=2676308 RepID=UPI0012BAD6F8|nr:helix-turn-helix domain-containing protein [Flavobacterium sp. MC2016-06]MBU3862327.1 helix-turn-helix domain-containing protein [Flavobacterium sp. MC2016-06]
MKYIIVIGIFQALLAAALLLRNKYRTNADDLLISLVICIGVHLSIKFFIFTFVQDREVLKNMITCVGFCYIPLLYLYALKTIYPKFVPASKWYIFIPFFISAIGYFTTGCVLAIASSKGYSVLYWYNTICYFSMIPFDIIYCFVIISLALKKLPEKIHERKLIIQVASIFLFLSLLSILFLTINSFIFSFNYLNRSISYAFLVVVVIRVITYKYAVFTDPLSQSSNTEMLVFDGNYSSEVIVNDEPKTEIKSNLLLDTLQEENTITASEDPILKPQKRKELLSDSQMFKIVLKLEEAMKIERYYRDSELTLDKLSNLTSLNKYHISETLNHFVNKPFYTFVNEYRIQYVKDKIKYSSEKNSSINILELAYESGFNSKSSFNRYFKEITSYTPTEYISLISRDVNSTDIDQLIIV